MSIYWGIKKRACYGPVRPRELLPVYTKQKTLFSTAPVDLHMYRQSLGFVWYNKTNMPWQCGYSDGMSPLGRTVFTRALPSGKPFTKIHPGFTKVNVFEGGLWFWCWWKTLRNAPCKIILLKSSQVILTATDLWILTFLPDLKEYDSS